MNLMTRFLESGLWGNGMFEQVVVMLFLYL